MAGDTYWSSVALLLPFDGANGFASTADKSITPKAVTFAGNAAISTTQSKFGGSSLYLDGTGDYLTCAAAADWTQLHTSSAKWTFEAWVKPDNWTGAKSLFSTNEGASANHGVYCGIDASTRTVNLQVTRGVGSSFVINGSFSGAFPNDSNWHHVAITYDYSLSSGNATLWIDGVASGTLNKTANAPSSSTATAAFKIGGFATTGDYAGYIDDLRVTLGSVRYGANFTPPSSAFVAGMGQVVGTVRDDANALCSRLVRAYRRDTGALVGQAYTQAGDSSIGNVVLLLHMDGTNGSTLFQDSGPYQRSVTVGGSAQISTAQAKFGVSSAYFNGSSYFGLTSGGAMGSGDFTVEGWANVTTLGQVLLSSRYTLGASTLYWILTVEATGQLLFQTRTSGGTQYYARTATGVVTTGTWFHFAATRASGVLRVFMNGVLGAVSSDNDGGLNLTEDAIAIGLFNYTGFVSYLNGYIDDLRITKGVARYTASFTPPSERFPDNNLALGNYVLNLPTLDEVNVIAYDDTAGSLYNDQILRVIPA